MLRIFSITGGSGAGKSHIVGRLRSRNDTRIIFDDFDVISQKILLPTWKGKVQSPLVAIKAKWPEAIDKDGYFIRKAIGQDQRNELRKVLGPATVEEVTYRILHAARYETGAQILILDHPLLFETGTDKAVSGVIVVTAPVEDRITRILARDNVDRKEAEARIAAQISDSERINKARAKQFNWIVDNSFSNSALVDQEVSDLLYAIRQQMVT
jgi:dephospho-CoA kinase